MSAAEKKRMDAVLETLGPPPEWISDTINNDDDVVDADVEMSSPDGILMHRPMPGSSESRMSVGVPDASKRATTDATTTARAGKKKSIACRKGVRVVVKRKMLKTSIPIPGAAWDTIKDMPDDAQLYGTCSSSCAKGCFLITFDLLPCESNEVSISRRHLRPLAKDEDEPEFSHQQSQEEMEVDEQGRVPSESECEEEEGGTGASASRGGRKKKVNYGKESQDEFLQLPIEDRRNAKSFIHKYGPGEDESIVWTILQDDEQILEDTIIHPPKHQSPLITSIPWDVRKEAVSFNDIFFDYFFPSLAGKARLMDEFFKDPRSGMAATIANDNIKFERRGDDPDFLLKICVTLMIAGANEVHNGVALLWKQGPSYGFRDYPNFAQFLPKNYFKAFVHAFPFMWADRRFWYMSRNDLPWDVFQPFVNEYNLLRRKMTDVFYVVLDESMSGWRPKTTPTGGLPNITFEPRKPVDLGTMIKNCCECITGMMVYHDMVAGAQQQGAKKYCDMPSHLPRGELIQKHVAEVLRQAEGANVKKGGWIGGDAWFGSINAAVELKCRLGINSTFIVKQNRNYCPIDVIRSILLARYLTRPAGHWVVMKATISGVDLFLMAYGWSQKGIAYMVSTCGTTVRHTIDYRSKFPDGYGNTDSRSYPRPSIAHFLYEFLPLIDEHNKARQNILALELKWPTKCCWFRLMTTFIGMAVVDVQRWDRNKRRNLPSSSTMTNEDDDFEEDTMGSVLMYADLIAKKLRDRTWVYRTGIQPTGRRGVHTDPDYVHPLVRYKKEGKLVNEKGKAFQRYCYVCRLYGENMNTQWACKECNMPLCNIARRGEEWACYDEHKSSNNEYDGCHGSIGTRSFIVPVENLKYRELPKKSAEQTRKDGVERRDNRRPKRAREREEEDEIETETETETEKEPTVVATQSNRRPKRQRARKDVVEEKEPSREEEEEDGATENSTVVLRRSTRQRIWEV